jgi:hypothetical protein
MKLHLSALVFFLASVSLSAQEYRATIVGTVTDPTGAAVADVKVTAINTETGVATSATANSEGAYIISFLLPGTYMLKVEHLGFKTLERGPVELRVNDRTRVDLQLQVGNVAEHITVVAEVQLLEQANADRGQVIDNAAITDLPLDARNPFNLMNLAVGVQFTGDPQYTRPFDNGAIADFSINGGRTGVNEYQIDGVSNNAITGTGTGMRANLAYVPPSEATQQFKVQTNAYDAQYGRTGGGVVSVSVKPGTSKYHGAAYEYMRRTFLEANMFLNNAQGRDANGNPIAPRPKRLVDQYGVELDGPVILPKVYNGRQKTFFMFSLEQFRQSLPQPNVNSVPTVEQREGDFSQTFTRTGLLYEIYDPSTNRLNPNFNPARSVSLTNLQYIRDQFAGNRIPKERFEPIALRVLKEIPPPNVTGDPVTHANNFYGKNIIEDTDFRNVISRVDHTITPSWRIYARWNHNYRDGGRVDYNGWGTDGSNHIHAGRRNDGAVLDLVGTMTPKTVFSARIGFNRFKQLSKYKPVDITSLGFPASLIGQLQIPDHFPIFTFTNYQQASNNEWDIIPSETYTAQVGVTRSSGTHQIRYGGEYRLIHYANFARGNASGTYAFNTIQTSLSGGQVTDSNRGNAIASLLLGVMNSATATLNAQPYLTWKFPAFYFQDDWQVSRRLTLNLGLRWDFEMTPVERYNRQNRGFAFDTPWPYSIAGLDLKGGLLFAGVNGVPRGAFNPDYSKIQPRFGMAYRVLRSKPLVFRGGLGRSALPTQDMGGTTGFSQTTTAEVTNTDFGAFRFLNNPFPSGLMQPPGAKLGLKAQVGDAITFSNQDRRVPYVWQYSAGFQYEIMRGMLVEAGYAGSRTLQISAGKNLNALTPDQLALGTAYLNQSFPNPFYGVLPAATSRGQQPTIQRRNLILPYPQYTTITMNNMSIGKTWYNSFQFKVERRFKQGFTALVSYTNSKTMEAVSFLNASDATPAPVLTAWDVPQRLMITGIYELPFGPRKQFLKSGILSQAVRGWKASWVGTIQSGTPISLTSSSTGNYYTLRDPKLKTGQTLDRWFDTTVCASNNPDPSICTWVARPSDTLRITPLYSPNIRRHTAPQVNTTLIRDFRITEKQKFQAKISAFNVSNTPIFNLPPTDPTSTTFGQVPKNQRGQARSVEIGLRYSF